MPGSTKILGKTPNLLDWEIRGDQNSAALTFERLIGQLLRKTTATLDGKVTVQATPSSQDYGRDFEIQARVNCVVFGIPFALPAARNVAKIFVECKSTFAERLDDSFLADATQHREGQLDYYILATNATITPYAQHRAQQAWRGIGAEFVLVDRFLLADAVKSAGLQDAWRSADITVPDPIVEPSRLVIEYQTDRRGYTDNHYIEIFLSLRSYCAEPFLAELSLATDNQWRLDQEQVARIIPPYRLESFSLRAERILAAGADTLRLTVQESESHYSIQVDNRDAELRFEPPFTGVAHASVARQVQEFAGSGEGFRILSIQGEAGVGKSRTLAEAIAPLQHGLYATRRHFVDASRADGGLPHFLKSFGYRPPKNSVALGQLLKEFVQQRQRTADPALLVLEDLHHGGVELIRGLKDLVLAPPAGSVPVVVIVTGRDDFTFPNEEYFSFLRLLTTVESPGIKFLRIPKLAPAETRQLIQSIIVNVPKVGVERIESLAENNPFIVVEVIQYLLDQKLAEILSRNTVGIRDVGTFAGRPGLPASVGDLYQRRLESLEMLPHGLTALLALGVASFFGMVFDPDVLEALLDGTDQDEIWSSLISRGFVELDIITGERRFRHENLLHSVKDFLLNDRRGRTFAMNLLNKPTAFAGLPPFDQGRILMLADRWSEAAAHFDEIWRCVRAITNFSSEEIPKSYFPYLPFVFKTGLNTQADTRGLENVALAKAYMGVHNFPLYVGLESCDGASTMLWELYGSEADEQPAHLAVLQLKAHALQNMGRSSEALAIMQRLDVLLRLREAVTPALEFDLYDRLQEHYRKMNDPDMSSLYAILAKTATTKVGDDELDAAAKKLAHDKLVAAHLITEATCALYTGKRRATAAARRARVAAETVKISRFIVYTRLGELVAEAIYSWHATSTLRRCYDEAKELLRLAARNNFADSLMRLELFLGTLALQCFDEEQGLRLARYYSTCGHSDSLRYGNGLFDWAFDNLAAASERPDLHRTELARQYLTSCHERLKIRGLLFLGAQGGSHPSFLALTNIVRFFGGFNQSRCLAYLGSAATHRGSVRIDDDNALRLAERAISGRPILGPSRSPLYKLRYPPGDGYFTPIF